MSTQAQATEQQSRDQASTETGKNDVTLRSSPSDRVQQFLQLYWDTKVHPGTDSNQRVNS